MLESFAQMPRDQFETGVEALAAQPDGQLRLAVEFVAAYFAAGESFLNLLSTSAHADPALRSAERKGEALRRASQRSMVRNWSRRGVLRPGLTAAQGADVLWALTSPSLYRMLVQERRWSRRLYAQWLHRSLRELLFDPSARNLAVSG